MKVLNTWKNKSGIYCIKNILNNKCYVGSSINIYTRLAKHKSTLTHNSHDNRHLQSAWNKYGKEHFACYILEYCEKEDLVVVEQKWVDKYGSYNLIKDVVRHTLSEQSKLKMSITRKARIASGEIIKYGSRPIQRYDLDGNFIDEFKSITEASIVVGISADQIARVLKKTHKTAKNFQWKYSNDPTIVEKYIGRDYTITSKKRFKKVLVLDTYIGVYEEFESVQAVAKHFGVCSPHISVVIRKQKKLYKGRYLLETL